MYAFFYNSPLEQLPIRLSLLKLILGSDLAFNALLYTDSKISEKYNSSKRIELFAFTNNLLAILLPTFIGSIIFILLSFLINSTNEFRRLFRNEEGIIKINKSYTTSILRKKEIIIKVQNIVRKHKIRVIFFYIIEFTLMCGFWYYVTIFCYLYKKTIVSWLLDTFITIIMRIIIDVFINLIFSALYKCSISSNSECIYKLIIFIYNCYC